MNAPYFSAPYFPVDALPPLIRNAVLAVQAKTKAPMSLVVSVILGAVSITCQNSINVRRPNMAASSCVLNILIAAESGERKSGVTGEIFQPIREFEERQAEKSKLKLKAYEAKFAAWEIRQKVILTEVEKQEKKQAETEHLILRLEEHQAKKPEKPLILKLLYSDVTPEALLFGLSEWPSAGLISDEAASVLNGRATHDLGMLNKLWDGTTQTTDRRGAGSVVIKEPRLTVLLAIQNKPLRQFLDRRGDQAREIGFLARYLVTRPDSTQGTRFIGYQVESSNHLLLFQERVTSILEKNVHDVEQGSFTRHTLGFTPEADLRWVNAHNDIEASMAPYGYLSDMKDYAAKIPENIARMAALFHYFEDGEGDISFEMVDRAAFVCSWYTDEFKRIFTPLPPVPVDQQEAQILERWLYEFVWCAGKYFIRKNEIRQSGPGVMRNKIRLERALDRLVRDGKIWFGVDENKTKYVNLRQDYYSGYGPSISML